MYTPGSHSTVVADNALAAPGVRLLRLAAPPSWSFRPGQVAELATSPGTDSYFAIASAPSEVAASGRLAFLVKAEGSDGEPLMRLAPGAPVTLRGPFGAGFELPAPAPAHDLLFVAAGTSLAAIRGAVVEALHDGASSRIAVVIGLRQATDLCFAEEVVAWVERGVHVRLALSHQSADLDHTPLRRLHRGRGRVQAQLADLAGAATHAFIAGSEALEDDVTRILVASHVDARNIQRNYRPDGRAG